MPGKYDVYVIADDTCFKVRPAVAATNAGGWFKVRNCTNFKVAVGFPSGVTAPGGSSPTIAPNGTAKYRIAAAASGVYSYTVHVSPAPGFVIPAVGESGPRIIVDP